MVAKVCTLDAKTAVNAITLNTDPDSQNTSHIFHYKTFGMF